MIENAQEVHAGTYTVIVSNAAGAITSQAATLTVGSGERPPIILTDPLSQTVAAGATVTFSVLASGSAPLTYQWRLNRVPIAGATAPTLMLTKVQTADFGSYSVVVTNPFGGVISQSAILLIGPAPIRFTEAKLVLGQGFQFRLAAPTGASYILETSTDLKIWAEVITLPNPTGTLQFTDRDAIGLSSGFYRIQQVQP